MKKKITKIYKKKGNHYLGWIKEIPGVNTQGKTLEETKNNLKEALVLILKINSDLPLTFKNDMTET